ncbi:hypothetical protein GcM3_034028, partial [Golovinomyces cichoracearum]
QLQILQTITPSATSPATQAPIYLTKSTEDAAEEARHLSLKRESIGKEYTLALDGVTKPLV